MELTSPPEMTTAITDLILAIYAIFLMNNLKKYKSKDNQTGIKIWMWIFGLTALVAFGGVPAHGLKAISEPGNIQYAYWMPLSFFLGMMISMFVVGVMYHWKGEIIIQGSLKVMLSLGIIFFPCDVDFIQIY
jgi:hypothetical protein